jgi:hypothetical protein
MHSHPSPSVGSLKEISGGIKKWVGGPLFVQVSSATMLIALAKSGPKMTAAPLSLWGKMHGPTKQLPTILAETLIENFC